MRQRVLAAGHGNMGTALGLTLCELGCNVVGVRQSAEQPPAPLRLLLIDVTDHRSLE